MYLVRGNCGSQRNLRACKNSSHRSASERNVIECHKRENRSHCTLRRLNARNLRSSKTPEAFLSAPSSTLNTSNIPQMLKKHQHVVSFSAFPVRKIKSCALIFISLVPRIVIFPLPMLTLRSCKLRYCIQYSLAVPEPYNVAPCPDSAARGVDAVAISLSP